MHFIVGWDRLDRYFNGRISDLEVFFASGSNSFHWRYDRNVKDNPVAVPLQSTLVVIPEFGWPIEIDSRTLLEKLSD